MEWLEIKSLIIDYSMKITFSLVILIFANYFINYVKKSFQNLLKNAQVMPALSTLLSDVIRFILWILTFALIFNILGLEEISLAMGGSIAVIGLGLAKSISNVVGDLIAGIFLILDEDFEVDNLVNTNKISGNITSIDIRKTKIKDLEGNLHIIPNKKIDENIIIVENIKDKK